MLYPTFCLPNGIMKQINWKKKNIYIEDWFCFFLQKWEIILSVNTSDYLGRLPKLITYMMNEGGKDMFLPQVVTNIEISYRTDVEETYNDQKTGK